MFKKKIDFLAIGDITIDAFIHIPGAPAGQPAESAAHVVCSDVEKEHCELRLPFPDKIPYDKVLEIAGVGNSANAAVSAARLGLRSSLVTDVGGDKHGKACIDALKKNGVDTTHTTIHKETETNYHYALWFDCDRTILINHHEYDYHFRKNSKKRNGPTITKPDPDAPRWIYLSSLGSNSYDYHTQIAAYLDANPSIKLAFQPGTFQMKLGIEKMSTFYKRSDVFIVNVEESQIILQTQDEDIENLLKGIQKLGPKIVLITDGPNGAYMLENGKVYFMPIYPDVKAPYERTGCGDAFASTFVSALILGKTPLEALTWAPINSMSVVEYVGAQQGLLSRQALESYLAKAPVSYAPKAYNGHLAKQQA